MNLQIGLDPQGIHELRNVLKDLAHNKGICVFISSHLLSEMELMCDRVAMINNGEIIKIETIKEAKEEMKDKNRTGAI